MTIRRVTAREFQKRFQRFEEPVLVNDGIFFPKIDVELHDHAVAIGASIVEEKSSSLSSDLERVQSQKARAATPPIDPENIKPGVHGKPKTRGPKKDLSKKAQSKGKMGR